MHERQPPSYPHPIIPRDCAGAAVDLHCHCLPGLDDGPATLAEALELCRLLLADGVGTVVATPHQLGRYEGRTPGPVVRDAVRSLQAELNARHLPLRVLSGGEVRMDERLPALLAAGEVLTLAGGRSLLLELPPDCDLDPLPVIRRLARDGFATVVAHPERERVVARRPEAVRRWVDEGASLQVTAGSVLGELGPAAERAAWWMLAQPLPVAIASDAHDARRRRPALTRAANVIAHRLGRAVAERVCYRTARALIARAIAVGSEVNGPCLDVEPDAPRGRDHTPEERETREWPD